MNNFHIQGVGCLPFFRTLVKQSVLKWSARPKLAAMVYRKNTCAGDLKNRL